MSQSCDTTCTFGNTRKSRYIEDTLHDPVRGNYLKVQYPRLVWTEVLNPYLLVNCIAERKWVSNTI